LDFFEKSALIQRVIKKKKGINLILEGIMNYGVGLGPSGKGFKPEQSFTAVL